MVPSKRPIASPSFADGRHSRMTVQHARQHHATDADVRRKSSHTDIQVVKPACQQFARVCGVVHVHGRHHFSFRQQAPQ